MEIQASKLRETMDLLKPAVPKKSTLTAATFIRLGGGKAVATDLETMVIANLPEAQDDMLLPFGPVAEMLKYVSDIDTLQIEVKGKTITISWPDGNASYPTESVAEYPVLPEMPARAETYLNGDALVAAMMAALPYAATEDTRPVLNGITLVLGNPIEVASGDGFRMSHQVLGLSFPLEEKVILPSQSVAILGHVFDKTPRTPPDGIDSLIQAITAKRQIHVTLSGDNKFKVDLGQSASVVINRVQGSPPDWLQLIPKGEPVLQSQLFAPQLEAAVRRVRNIAKGGSGIVRMEFNDSKVVISAQGKDQKISATLDTILTEGAPGRTALNYRYLLDYLSGKQGIVALYKYTDTGPVVFKYQQTPRVLIMPMHVEWGDEKKETPEEAKVEPEVIENPEDEPATEPVTEELTDGETEETTPEGEAGEDTTAEQQEPVAAEVAPAKTPAKRKRKS